MGLLNPSGVPHQTQSDYAISGSLDANGAMATTCHSSQRLEALSGLPSMPTLPSSQTYCTPSYTSPAYAVDHHPSYQYGQYSQGKVPFIIWSLSLDCAGCFLWLVWRTEHHISSTLPGAKDTHRTSSLNGGITISDREVVKAIEEVDWINQDQKAEPLLLPGTHFALCVMLRGPSLVCCTHMKRKDRRCWGTD